MLSRRLPSTPQKKVSLFMTQNEQLVEKRINDLRPVSARVAGAVFGVLG